MKNDTPPAPHTPTPWRVEKAPPADESELVITTDKTIIASIGPYCEMQEPGSPRSNAALIVRAVNAHAGLVAALERAANELQAIRLSGFIPEENAAGTPEGLIGQLHQAENQTRAALAAAKA